MSGRQNKGSGYVAALVARLGGEVIITDEEAARAGELAIDYSWAMLQTRITIKPEQLVGEIVTAEPQSIEPARAAALSNLTGHQCESWQVRRNADGGRYCAACGATR